MEDGFHAYIRAIRHSISRVGVHVKRDHHLCRLTLDSVRLGEKGAKTTTRIKTVEEVWGGGVTEIRALRDRVMRRVGERRGED